MDIEQKYDLWLNKANGDSDLKPELLKMDAAAKNDAFYRDLAFGTGGLRGKIGAGTNRMNIYTVAKATQGLSLYIKKHFDEGNRSVAISYDSRIKSDLFAFTAAKVFAGNGIKVHLYPTLMPVPCLSFATRYYHCSSGVMVTASHNPSIYNGYKVYGPDGCQITTIAAEEILSLIESVDPFEDVLSMEEQEAREKGLIEEIGKDCYDAFVHQVESLSLWGKDIQAKKISIVYTPLHGSGLKPVTRVLDEMGFKDVHVVKEQENPDGNFTTCPYPNPEIVEAMQLGLEEGKRVGADLVMATDPDCDRIGIAVRNKQGEYPLVTGNELGLLLFQYILERRSELGTMPNDPVMIKTIVTTDLADQIASSHHVKTINVLTGFKFIGEQIALLEKEGKASSFLFGFEESYGCLAGTYVRDKDAVAACMLTAEMTAYYLEKGQTLFEVLEDIYARYGYRSNSLASYEFDGEAGFHKMVGIMNEFRTHSPSSFASIPVKAMKDYLPGIDGLPSSDVIKYFLEDGSTLVLRPSGTEPKIKIYFSIVGKDSQDIKNKKAVMKEQIERMF